MQTIWYHLKFYESFLYKSWDAISPMQYGCMLAGVGLIGWMLMYRGPAQ